MKKMGILFLFGLFLWCSLKDFQVREFQRCKIQWGQSCRDKKRNPARLADSAIGVSSALEKSLSHNREPKATGKIWGFLKKRIEDRCEKAPTVQAFQFAIWQGDLSGVPFWLIQKYQERGLLPVLALSGQHVSSLVLPMALIGVLLFRVWGSVFGRWYFWFSKAVTPLATGVLFSCASQEPSMIRTSLCSAFLLMIQGIPLVVNRIYVYGIGILGFLTAYPKNLSSTGFILSAVGALGVYGAQFFFHADQKVAKTLWLSGWFMSLVAFFFGKWVGVSLFLQWSLSFVWDELFLPILFFVGILLISLPRTFGMLVAQASEKGFNAWLAWEAQNTHITGMSLYRPTFGEVVLFLLWLCALGYWNLQRYSEVSK